MALPDWWWDKMTSRIPFQPKPFCNAMSNLDVFILLANDFQKASSPLLFQKCCCSCQPWLKLVNFIVLAPAAQRTSPHFSLLYLAPTIFIWWALDFYWGGLKTSRLFTLSKSLVILSLSSVVMSCLFPKLKGPNLLRHPCAKTITYIRKYLSTFNLSDY